MNQQLPQITRRRIGAVVILDIKGELVGPWALKAKDSIADLISENIKNLIINLKELSTVDSLGVKAISSNLHMEMRNAFISGRASVMQMFSRLDVLRDIKVFSDEDGIVEYFGKEFVESDELPYVERRVHQRLKTALPLEFHYEDTQGNIVVFKAIVTDLSKGGLFAEYLDLEMNDTPGKVLDPYEIKKIDLKIKLPGYDYIYASGKVLRSVITGEQLGLGITFDRIDENDVAAIVSFLTN